MTSAAYKLEQDTAADFLDHVGRCGVADGVRGIGQDQDLAISLEITVYEDREPSYDLIAVQQKDGAGRYGNGTRIKDHGTVPDIAMQYLAIMLDETPLLDDVLEGV